MKKRLMTVTVVAAIFGLLYSCSFTFRSTSKTDVDYVQDEERGRDYFIKPGDSLGLVALKIYGDGTAYAAIIEGTNYKAGYDRSYKIIRDPDDIVNGQKIWVPISPNLESKDMEYHKDNVSKDNVVHKSEDWGYRGSGNPTAWGSLNPEFKKCDKGRKQSPINISSKRKTIKDQLNFNYQPTQMNIVNNGRTIEVNCDEGSELTINENVYELMKFTFHVPSEHTVNGMAAGMEMQLSHVDWEGKQAIVSILFDIGKKDNTFFANILNRLPSEGNEATIRQKIDVVSAFDTYSEKYSYKGSLTIPPCSEDVTWYIIKNREQISKRQLGKFVSHFGLNARPTQR